MCDFNASTLVRLAREIADLDNELAILVSDVFKFRYPRILEDACRMIDYRGDLRAKEVLETMVAVIRLARGDETASVVPAEEEESTWTTTTR